MTKKTWHLGTHLRVLGEFYPMNTYQQEGVKMVFKRLWSLDEGSLSIRKVKLVLFKAHKNWPAGRTKNRARFWGVCTPHSGDMFISWRLLDSIEALIPSNHPASPPSILGIPSRKHTSKITLEFTTLNSHPSLWSTATASGESVVMVIVVMVTVGVFVDSHQLTYRDNGL